MYHFLIPLEEEKVEGKKFFLASGSHVAGSWFYISLPLLLLYLKKFFLVLPLTFFFLSQLKKCIITPYKDGMEKMRNYYTEKFSIHIHLNAGLPPKHH